MMSMKFAELISRCGLSGKMLQKAGVGSNQEALSRHSVMTAVKVTHLKPSSLSPRAKALIVSPEPEQRLDD